MAAGTKVADADDLTLNVRKQLMLLGVATASDLDGISAQDLQRVGLDANEAFQVVVWANRELWKVKYP